MMTGEVEQTATGETASAAETAEAEAAFAQGFAEEPVKAAEVVTPTVETVVAETPADEAKPAETPAADKPAAEKPAVGKPAAPKYARITQEELDELRAVAKTVKEYGPRFDKLAGTTGSLKQAIDKLGPSYDRAALDELKKDFPEIAGHLERILGGAKVTPEAKPATTPVKPVSADATSDPESIRREANEKQFKDELAELAADYPDWQDIVARSDTPDAKNPFRAWLASEPAEYQTKINDTLSPRVIARAIDRFRAVTATPRPAPEQRQAPAPKTAAASNRRNVVANAVTPRTAGGQPQANVKTEADHFADGFRG